MKKIILSIILFFSTLMVVDASSISMIDMDIFVDKNGVATVTEIWNANVTEGTEGWHPYYNIGSSEIFDVKVKMDGREFSTVESWNENSGLSDKAFKAGLYYPKSNEVDIVFGISSYGTHEYVIQYKISNFVSTTNDADIVYWNLFPKEFSASPDNAKIKIYSDFRYEDSWGVWVFGKGMKDNNYIYDGVFGVEFDQKINSDEYVVVLMQFPKGTFQTNSVLDNEFDSYLEMAKKGATSYSDKKSIFDIIMPIITGIIYFIPFIIMFVLALFTAKKNNNVRFGSAGNKVKKDVPNFREIPCNKDLFRAYWVANNYNLSKKKEDFLGSVILKWLRDGNVKIEKVTKNGLFKEKEDTNIVFEKEPDGVDLESQLYNYMFTASGDGKLESGEFKKWCSNHYSKILKWFDDVLEYENKMLVTDGKAQIVSEGKVFKHDVYQIDDSMMIDAEQMAGLKKFLKEFSMIKEREAIEVHLWNEYLMYAQIFGIADEVASQFKKLYPEVIQEMESMGYGYNDVIFIHSISSDGIKSATSAREKAQAYSAGGGGSSFSGGGGGSFGGGGGGGGFR